MICIRVAFNYMANLGLGPWGVLHDGISKTINITYGQAGILTSLLALLLWIPLKQKPGIATIFDAFWIGLTADFVINIIPIATIKPKKAIKNPIIYPFSVKACIINLLTNYHQ